MPRLSRTTLTRLYVAAVIGAGTALLTLFAARLAGAGLQADLSLLPLAVAVVLGELVPIRVGPDQGEIAPSTAFTFALLIGYGAPVALIVQAIASLVADARSRKPAVRIWFNVAQYAISIAVAAAAYVALAGPGTASRSSTRELAALACAGLVYFVANTGGVATVVALSTGSRLREELLGGGVMRQAVTESILLAIAPLALVALDTNPLLFALLIVPVVAVQRAGRHAELSQHLAGHDALSGLPNRVRFQERAEIAIATAEPGRPVVIMLIDLDRFKEVNDTLGHHYGDEVLRQMAARLLEHVPASETVARLGGDEFAVLLTEPPSTQAALHLADDLSRVLGAPFDAAGVRLELGASVGVASYPEDGTDVDTLLRRADIAMYQAKSGTSGVERYRAEADATSLARLQLAGDLRRALEAGEFEVHFQPKLELRTGRPCGAEALLRWTRDGQPVRPDTFIAVAEQTGFVVPLTLHVLRRSLEACAGWRRAGARLGVAVNLSARVLLETGLPERVAELCRETGVPASDLVLEITESMVVADPARAMPTVEGLAALGCVISVDDFGTGYSSLEYLKRLPVGEIKVDRGFVLGMQGDPRDEAIVRSTVQLGHDLGLAVVAEGIETARVAAVLAAMGCDVGQGYHFAAAMPAQQLLAWVRAFTAPPPPPAPTPQDDALPGLPGRVARLVSART